MWNMYIVFVLAVHQMNLVHSRAQPDCAYEFPDWTGPDTQICRTSMGYQFSYDKVPGHKFGVKTSKFGCI
jgi:hypothetical protein